MSWIKDVVHELNSLDLSVKSLRKFGITIGIVFILISILFWGTVGVRIFFLVVGSILFVNGIISPDRLKTIYKFWMGFAFALGWVVSRMILTLLFILVMIPVGLIAKVFGKKFLDLKWGDTKSSYWIMKENKEIDYEKMY
ncbi:MAG TPA: SxtJ family membrane protein [Melioribacteraceae bacterium]|nr:SxtJ family membrane protein [Melioribacteraceae bacterium]